MGGSGGGSGGGTSGKVDYPDYMKMLHANMLSGTVDPVAGPIIEHFTAGNCLYNSIELAQATSPYTGEDAYDPDTDIALFIAALATFSSTVNGLSTTWSSYVTNAITGADAAIDDASIDAVTTAHGAVLDDRLQSDILPRFQTGMRDINAVISSSFVVGEAILEAFAARELADFDAKLRVQSYGQRIQLIAQGVREGISLKQLKLAYSESVSRLTTEAYRIKVVMKKEELDEHFEILFKDYTWGIELYQYGANAMGSIAGSAVSAGNKGPSKFQSALGGAMSGAATGAMLSGGNPIATGVGAMVGMAGGLFG